MVGFNYGHRYAKVEGSRSRGLLSRSPFSKRSACRSFSRSVQYCSPATTSQPSATGSRPGCAASKRIKMTATFPQTATSPHPNPDPTNTQMLANSPLKEMDIGPDLNEALFGQREPTFAIIHEKPEHRVILWMKARGCSNREVAQASGYTEPWISQLCRQAWFIERLLKEMRTAGKDEIQSLLEGAGADSVLKLIELRDTAKNPAVQRQSAVDLLDRFLGKPTQRVESDTTVHLTNEDVGALDIEIKQLEDQEAQLLGRRTQSAAAGAAACGNGKESSDVTTLAN